MITAETKEKNYRLFLKKLQSIGLPVDNINANYGNAIMNASFTITNEKGNAYDGSLLEIILKTLTPYALKLNELLPQALQVERDSLIKVSLLHHLSKALTIIPNDNQWEIENEVCFINIIMIYRHSVQECTQHLFLRSAESNSRLKKWKQ